MSDGRRLGRHVRSADERADAAGGARRIADRPGSKAATDRVAVTIVRRSSGGGDAARALMTGGASQGAWLVRARYRSGSLESIVSRSRRRNLAISLGVLGLLGAAFLLLIGGGAAAAPAGAAADGIRRRRCRTSCARRWR